MVKFTGGIRFLDNSELIRSRLVLKLIYCDIK